MAVLESSVDPRSSTYLDSRGAMLRALAELEAALTAAREGGGERAVARHHARGKLLPRERIDLLVDRDTPLLELCPVAGYGTDGPVGAAVVTALAVVAGRICVLIANDPTVRDGTAGSATLARIARAQRIALRHRVPVVNLVEGVGIDAAERAEVSARAGRVSAAAARLVAAGVPCVSVSFSHPDTVAGVDLTGSCDRLVVTGPAGTGGRIIDHYAQDEREALWLVRQCVRRWRAPAPDPPGPVVPPTYDPEDLLAVPAGAAGELLARLLDGSEFDETWPEYGRGVCTGWGHIHGHQVAVVVDRDGLRGGEETEPVCRLVAQAAATGSPLIHLRRGFADPAAEATVAAALARDRVPAVTVRVGDWRGSAAVSGQARFRFAWPTAAAAAVGDDEPFESALRLSGRQADDGVIDPRDTRTVLGFCLAVIRGGGGGT